MSRILIVNAGSSSIKLAVFGEGLKSLLTAEAAGIGDSGELRIGGSRQPAALADHADAFERLLEGLAAQGYPAAGFDAAGHRVVHGGASLTRPERVTAALLDRIDACSPLAPLHNPHNAAAIRTLTALLPDLPQVACFDTAFHATNPETAVRYAVPPSWQQAGIRRYGFHGLSYEALLRRLAETTGTAPPPRLLACHLGNGASLCAIADGQSVATTMGYSPLEGLTMGTRSGSIDAGAVLDRAEQTSIAEVRRDLQQQSGLLGLSGLSNDMRALLEDGGEAASFAVEHFCYWCARHAGSMIAAMEGIDAIAFTGGIGENSEAIRTRVLQRLSWTGVPDSAVHVIPADEERQIALHTGKLLHLE
ncbi:acetate/propionate family kinase [Leisingera aquaemixtae]|uniref:acetate/propionate family kinase n=1 Tax=Leisingera aquaemixtae TaxID=1396826 RepID=UPI0021A54504|nr:acetate/propionate family kinase [Leisingera aquaemixtae]UWQ37826.1 acetate/propionate family kinase [Leisingera aquaemixtae]